MSAQPAKLETPFQSKKRNLSDPPLGFVPYSLREYRNLAGNHYQVLGGLGPSYMGSEQWELELSKRKRRDAYAKNVQSFSAPMDRFSLLK